MKKQILGILVMAAVAVGIIAGVSSCKKEEVKPVTPTINPTNPVEYVTKSDEWVNVKKGIEISGRLCDVYKNINTGQEVLVEKHILNKSNVSPCSRDFHLKIPFTDENIAKHYVCDGSGNECLNGTMDGKHIIILCQ